MKPISTYPKLMSSLSCTYVRLIYILCFLPAFATSGCKNSADIKPEPSEEVLEISRETYQEQLYGFWLGQCIANWTGLITEMDKIGGDGVDGKAAGFYTRENWGGPDEPNLWNSNNYSEVIDFIYASEDSIWGADDDTDIEYIYQYTLARTDSFLLSPAQIRDAWLHHIHKEEENFLWVSNQQAFDLMHQGMLPPKTSDPEYNPHYEMIDAQLTTEIFGFFAPARPDIALQMAHLPIRTTAQKNAAWIAEFHVILYSLASYPHSEDRKEQILWMAEQARKRLPDTSYAAHMYDYVRQQYRERIPWEIVRDSLYQKYQLDGEAGYNWGTDDTSCNGCFSAGINFGAGLISLFYGEGDFKETIKIGVLAGWDSDNPTATWGGLLGFMMGKEGIETVFGRSFSNQFNIHRTRKNFPNEGLVTFEAMSAEGMDIVERVLRQAYPKTVYKDSIGWKIPLSPIIIEAAE